MLKSPSPRHFSSSPIRLLPNAECGHVLVLNFPFELRIITLQSVNRAAEFHSWEMAFSANWAQNSAVNVSSSIIRLDNRLAHGGV